MLYRDYPEYAILVDTLLTNGVHEKIFMDELIGIRKKFCLTNKILFDLPRTLKPHFYVGEAQNSSEYTFC